ncbi:3-deoxy-D-manno-octulosonic acid kinase [Microbulbifer halophilus]|uniref:3-deoxy-D-manno-octulosonic acid kinase n=1 Tax=Microbulbifer halophilus TaxID=453963 RepID=UPI00361CC3E3
MHCRQFEGVGSKGEKSQILYDSELVGTDCEQFFDREWLARHCDRCAPKRGQAVLFRYGELELVYKRYHRGGLPGRVVKRSYWYHSLEETRMWQEFHLLEQMRSVGLPVPRPVAARCEKLSSLTYGGELVTEKIPDSQSLTEMLSRAPLPAEAWSKVGRAIADFHRAQVFHADLNASNILLTRDGRVYLVDFDKSEIREKLTARAAAANLQRLNRSLCKLRRRLPVFHFHEDGWSALRSGYDAAVAEE